MPDAEIQFANVDDLKLDHLNPRLGREATEKRLDQEAILKLMRDWSLEELAVSFLETGFWYQEPLVVVEEKLGKNSVMVVVEGNRRLAALKLLKNSFEGHPPGPAWAKLVDGKKPKQALFSSVPYFTAKNRNEVAAFLGFRHVTGIKEWRPSEKAEFIAHLIDTFDLGYDQVRRRIGSKTDTVRRNYIAYHILLQMEDMAGVDVKLVEDRFSVLFLSLRTEGVQKYLGINLEADPEEARTPVPKKNTKNLKNYAIWLFGTKDQPPIFTDSRRIEQFGRVLLNEKSLEYLLTNENPKLDFAVDLAGADAPDVIERIEAARDNLQYALGRAHLYKRDKRLKSSVSEVSQHLVRLLELYPDIRKDVLELLTRD